MLLKEGFISCSKQLLGWLSNEKFLSLAYTKLEQLNKKRTIVKNEQKTGKLQGLACLA